MSSVREIAAALEASAMKRRQRRAMLRRHPDLIARMRDELRRDPDGWNGYLPPATIEGPIPRGAGRTPLTGPQVANASPWRTELVDLLAVAWERERAS